MEICEQLRAYLAWRELAYDGESQGSLQFVQLLMQEAAGGTRTQATARELEMIAFANAPRFECRFRKQNSEGVPYAPHRDFHAVIITSYYTCGNVA
jgi:hypothetical protein